MPVPLSGSFEEPKAPWAKRFWKNVFQVFFAMQRGPRREFKDAKLGIDLPVWTLMTLLLSFLSLQREARSRGLGKKATTALGQGSIPT
jgi:hypothetical protein